MKQIVNFSKTRLLAETSYQFHLGIQARIKSETADKLEITEEAVSLRQWYHAYGSSP